MKGGIAHIFRQANHRELDNPLRQTIIDGGERMSQKEFSVVVDDATRPYLKRMTGGTTDARENVALIDIYIRIAYTLVICASRQAGAVPILAHALPGTGSMLASIASAQSWPDVETSHWAARVVTRVARDFTALLGQFNADSTLPTFKTVRNQLAHGHALPARDDEATEIVGRLGGLRNALKECFAVQLGELRLVDNGVGAELLGYKPDMKLSVWPFWAWIDADSAWGIYSHYGQDGIFYLVPGHQVALRRDDHSTNQFEKQYLPEARGSSPLIGRHVKDVVRDIAAFTEDGVAPSYCFGDDAEVGVVLIPWVRSTSDMNQERIDRFRIGPDNQYQWLNQEGTGWRPYSDFLREVANWGILARRIRIGLDSFRVELQSAEADYFHSSRTDDVRGPARLKEVSEQGDCITRPVRNDVAVVVEIAAFLLSRADVRASPASPVHPARVRSAERSAARASQGLPIAGDAAGGLVRHLQRCRRLGSCAYFSPSWTAFQADRGRDFSVIVDGVSF
jgi:hypothetical protein